MESGNLRTINLNEKETVHEVKSILRERLKPPPGTFIIQYEQAGSLLDIDEVYPNLYISDGKAAKNKELLKDIGITYILNAAEGNGMFMVNTSKEYYEGTGIKYMGLQLRDVSTTLVSPHFHTVAEFIDEGISSNKKVLVHCSQGISRSSTFAIAYLMIKKHMTIQEAARQIRTHRKINPNSGFIFQLVKLNMQLQSCS